jgi:serine/threonine protein kinase
MALPAIVEETQLFYPGLRLDRYELLCPLAQGGMGAVWLARYAGKFGFSRLVVVKVMLPQYAREENMRSMFIDEARIAASIDHPNVVSTLDVGEDRGLLFLVMDWVDGDSLSRLVKQVRQNGETVPPGIVLKMASDVCAGLHAAHEQRDPSGELRGVIHRDVSPQNILLSTTGRAMLIDFGIAKANKRISEETSVGQIKGKLSYMSPEHARSQRTDRRADVFSVGAVLYELFAGFPPFERENDVQTLVRLTRGGPPAPLPKNTPIAVQEVVMQALAFDAAQRFQTAADLGDAIVHAMHQIGAPTTDNEVARYTDEYLSVRRAQRQRAVVAALGSGDETATERMQRAPPNMPSGESPFANALAFDASPFASALGPYAQSQMRGATVPLQPGMPDDYTTPMRGAVQTSQRSPAPHEAAAAWVMSTLMGPQRRKWSLIAMVSIAISSVLAALLLLVKMSAKEPDAAAASASANRAAYAAVPTTPVYATGQPAVVVPPQTPGNAIQPQQPPPPGPTTTSTSFAIPAPTVRKGPPGRTH